ncbi:MAG: YopX family protein [bacterium]
MRTIKFKAKYKFGYITDENGNAPWIYWTVFEDCMCDLLVHGKIDKETLCQFTGQFDEIYEGDILRPVIINGCITDGVVIFYDASFMVKQLSGEKLIEDLNRLNLNYIEVIGNAHDK